MARVVLFNKPYGVLPQFTDREGRLTLAAYGLPKSVYPAGRLDQDSEGLLVLTDDGLLQHRISDPLHKLPKTYWVQVEHSPGEAALEQLRRGVRLKDGLTAPARIRAMAPPAIDERVPPIRHRLSVPTAWLEITITEGRNRQVRRMTAAVGHPTLRLIRCAVGDWTLDGLAPGQWRTLTVPTSMQRRQSHGVETQRHGRRSH